MILRSDFGPIYLNCHFDSATNLESGHLENMKRFVENIDNMKAISEHLILLMCALIQLTHTQSSISSIMTSSVFVII